MNSKRNLSFPILLFSFLLLMTLASCNTKKKVKPEFDVQNFIGHWLQKNEKLPNTPNNSSSLSFMTIKPDLNVIEYTIKDSQFESNIPPELNSEENYYTNIASNENNPFFLSEVKIKSLRDQGLTENEINAEIKKANLISISFNADKTITKKIALSPDQKSSSTQVITFEKIDDSTLNKLKQDKLQTALDDYLERAPLLDLIIGHKFELTEAASVKKIDGKDMESVLPASKIKDQKPIMKNDKVYITVTAKTIEFKNPKNSVLINNRYSAQFFFIKNTGTPATIQFSHESEKILNNTFGIIKETPEGLDIIDSDNSHENETTIWKYKKIF